MKLRRDSLFVRFCYLWSSPNDSFIPARVSVCRLFWQMIGAAIFHLTLGPVLVGVGIYLLFSRVLIPLVALMPVARIGERMARVKSIPPVAVAGEWLKAAKSRVCPLIELTDDQ